MAPRSYKLTMRFGIPHNSWICCSQTPARTPIDNKDIQTLKQQECSVSDKAKQEDFHCLQQTNNSLQTWLTKSSKRLLGKKYIYGDYCSKSFSH